MKKISLLLLFTLIIIIVSLCINPVRTNVLNLLLMAFVFICSFSSKFDKLHNIKKLVLFGCILNIYISVTLIFVDLNAQKLGVQVLFFIPAIILVMPIFYFFIKFVKEKNE